MFCARFQTLGTLVAMAANPEPPDGGRGGVRSSAPPLVSAPSSSISSFPPSSSPLSSSPPSSTTTTATSAWAGGRSSVGSSISASLRSYAQIQADATAAAASSSSSSKITLQFRLAKVQVIGDDGTLINPKSLSHDQFGDFLFDILKINPDDCLEIDLSGRWDTKELVLKTGTLVDHLLTTSQPCVYLSHEISITNVVKNVTKVYFKNVPPSVPDEEIIQICLAYSEPVDGKVHRETMRLGTTTRRNITGTTRYVDVRLHPGKFFKNFYWLEGPLPGDQGRRITVLHNQPQQCSHCFRYAPSFTTSGPPCPGGGNGKLCEHAMTPRTKMSDYMTLLKLQDRYIPMKTLFLEQKAKSFPGLQRRGQAGNNLPSDGSTPSEDIDNLDASNIEEEQEVLAQTPLQQRETEVVLLKRQLEKLQAQVDEGKSTSEAASRSADILIQSNQDQLIYARKNHEIRMADLFGDQETDWESSECRHLINSYSVCVNLTEFEYDQERNLLKAKNANFMKFLVTKGKIESEMHQEIFNKVRDLVLARLTDLAFARQRSMSRSGRDRRHSVSGSVKRNREGEEGEDNTKETSKVKLATPETSPPGLSLPPASLPPV